MKTIEEKIKTKDLLKLPIREWNKKSVYGSICIVNTRKKHESGYALIAIIGMNNLKPVEIAAFCDDINWKIAKSEYLDIPNLRTDMFFPSGIVHFHRHGYSFEVCESLSSTNIKVLKL